MRNPLLLTSLLLVASALQAAEVAAKYACPASLSPERLTKAFIDRGFIGKAAYTNEDSISYFAAQPGATAFGFPLVAVASFEEGSSFFGRVPGTSPGNRFALVVQAGEWQVKQAALAQKLSVSTQGSQSYPQLRIESFSNSYPEPLPKAANPRYVYTQVLCLPRV